MQQLAHAINGMFLLVLILINSGLGGCNESDESGRALGDSCSRTTDCADCLRCIDQVCVQPDSEPDGDASEMDDDSLEDVVLDHVWIDGATGLMWQNPPAEQTMNWEDALAYCEDLELNGEDDWRLPSLFELRSLIRGCPQTEIGGECNMGEEECMKERCQSITCGGCVLDDSPTDDCYWSADLEGKCTCYWSSMGDEDNDYRNWGVCFNIAYVDAIPNLSDGIYVRCAR